MLTNKMKIRTTNVPQAANEILGKKESNLYYLVIENNQGEKLIINVGKKTHDSVEEMKKNEEITEITKKKPLTETKTEK